MACTNASFAALSDTLAQSIAILKSPMAMTSGVQTSQQFDYVRLTRYSTYGFLIAPVVYNWFNLLDKRFPFPQQIAMGKNDAQIRRETMRTVLKRMIVDQTAFAPVGLALFFGVMGLMEANGLQAVKDKFAEAYFPALKANYAVWPLVQLLNFLEQLALENDDLYDSSMWLGNNFATFTNPDHDKYFMTNENRINDWCLKITIKRLRNLFMGRHSLEETLFAQPVDVSAFKTTTIPTQTTATAATTLGVTTTMTTTTTPLLSQSALTTSTSAHLVSSTMRRSSMTNNNAKKPYSNGVKVVVTLFHHRLILRNSEPFPPATPPSLIFASGEIPSKVECLVRARIPTPTGEFFLHLYRNNRDNKEHLAVVYGEDIRSKSLDIPRPGETEMDRIMRGAYIGRLKPGQTRSDDSSSLLISSMSSSTSITENQKQLLSPPLVRIHSECFTGETVQSARCDCGEQLQEAMRLIQSEGRGVIVYLRQEGRGIGLAEKLRAYNLQDLGHDTVTANLLLHHPPDLRNYDIATQILADLNLTRVRLLTNNPDKIEQVEGDGLIKVVERIPMVPHAWQHDHDPNRHGHEVDQYLKVKVERMRHLLNVPESLLR
ncbi:88_t:CDS:2 [Ambispora gerdemannii]|uniref:GTP cyclohydrolase II n=1 Tax=Ambispora gerdemannii TaxID=144530 RepID=A0A9N8VRC3_9GLOM|nr:88_t:CDS:2 [Ambispora gerdemannii]